MLKYCIVILGLALSACSSVVTTQVVSQESVLGQDILAAESNLKKAVEVGVLGDGDPALACLSGIVADLNLAGEPAPGFEPEKKGLVSLGSVVYIRAQQAKAFADFKLNEDCEAVVGRFVLDSARAAAKVLPFR